MTASAWTVTDPERRVELRSTFDALPTCEQRLIDKRLRTVKFTKKIHFPKWADSFGFGLTLLSDDLEGALLDRVFVHEMGHMFDWSLYPRPSESPEFGDAIRLDFSSMTPKKAHENDYLQSPREAFAELFSAHFLPLTYAATDFPYNIELMPRTQKVFLKELYLVCPE